MANCKDKRGYAPNSNRGGGGPLVGEPGGAPLGLSDRLSSRIISRRDEVFVISPGLVLLLIGLCIIIFPRFFLTLVALFIALFGALLCFVGWKFLQFKRKVVRMAQDLEAKVYVHGVQVVRGGDETEESDESDIKKFILH